MTVDYTLPKSELGPRITVSPFIRFARWGLLIAGISYGIKRNRTLQAREDAHRKQLREKKVIWDAEQAKLANSRTREQLLQLAKDLNIPIPADFDKQYPPV